MFEKDDDDNIVCCVGTVTVVPEIAVSTTKSKIVHVKSVPLKR